MVKREGKSEDLDHRRLPRGAGVFHQHPLPGIPQVWPSEGARCAGSPRLDPHDIALHRHASRFRGGSSFFPCLHWLPFVLFASTGYFSLQYAVLLDLPYVSLEKESSSTRLHERHDDDFSSLLPGIVFSHVLREEASIAATRQ